MIETDLSLYKSLEVGKSRAVLACKPLRLRDLGSSNFPLFVPRLRLSSPQTKMVAEAPAITFLFQVPV